MRHENELKIFIENLKMTDKSDKTIAAYVQDLNEFFEYVNKHPKKVKQCDITQYLLSLKDNGLVASTRNRKLSTLKSFYKTLVKIGVLKFNPAYEIEVAKLPIREIRAVDVKVINKMINTADNVRDKLIFSLLYATAIRREELVRIEVAHLNIEKERLTVIGKGNKQRTVYFDKKTRDLLLRYMLSLNNKWLFPSKVNPANHITTRAVNGVVEKWRSKVGINITPHTFRHTSITQLHKEGMDVLSLQKVAGHSRLTTTQLYVACDDDTVQAKYDKIRNKRRM